MGKVTMKSPALPIRSNRFGFQYFEDHNHYREYDLSIWLPILKTLGASWLLLKCPPNRAIPENFITSLVEAGIEPILHFSTPVDGLPNPTDIEPILLSYQRWGCHLSIFFDQPNSRTAWKTAGWTQEDLVERFLDHFLPYTSVALQNGLIPVFPPLLPGGDYWDTAFLRSSLEALERRKQFQVLETLVLSAYAWTHDHELDWGAGGPERWPDARPYFTPADSQDQLGIRIGDWYQAISSAVLQQTPPTILIQLGAPSHSLPLQSVDPDLPSKINLICGRLLNGEEVDHIEPLSPSVMAGIFSPLASEDARLQDFVWFQADGSPSSFASEWQSWIQTINQQSSGSKSYAPPPSEAHPLSHYLLLPHADAGFLDWQWDAIRPYVKKYSPTVGFSVLEAALASHVTVLGSEDEFPEEVLNQLRSSGCWVERISGNGTDVATSLAER
jgi:hypothetical protein